MKHETNALVNIYGPRLEEVVPLSEQECSLFFQVNNHASCWIVPGCCSTYVDIDAGISKNVHRYVYKRGDGLRNNRK